MLILVAAFATDCGARTGLSFAGSRADAGAPAPAPTPTRAPTAIPPTAQQARADKIDLLFVVDDSGSMRDKQVILARALPDLVARLINPLCVDPTTLAPSATQPNGPLAPCPSGTLREFNSVQDLHIGVVSTSLGGVGAPSCGVGFSASPANDHGHLRAPSTGPAAKSGFIAWDPAQVGDPPGEKDPTALATEVKNLVSLGEGGCPYEMPLEGMYRFLIDPEPYEKMQLAPCNDGVHTGNCAVQVGIDDELLAERKSFLRYDSLVAVVVLTDENDCSLTAGGLSYHVFDDIGTMARATSQCAANPDDRCCRSCDDPTPSGCPDSQSDAECQKGPYTAGEDSGLLRCFDQKRQYGRDYLYPTSRYIDGLTGKRVPNQKGDLVPNPLFEDPTGQAPRRDASLVFFAAIIGVPWQDIAENPSDTTHLALKNADEMERDGTWDLVLPNSDTGAAPRDPLMIETIAERTGVQPIVGVPLAPDTANSPRANPINGHETALGDAPVEPQYDCIFDLTTPEQYSADCTFFSGSHRAICQADDGSYGSTQYRGKSYPGVRELQVLRGVGHNAVAASICARNVTDDSRDDFGYRPVLTQILDRLRVGLN
ncbi:MAG TPA: hypothetical protein VHC69_16605 [Polyangiaceae bacterium]|nr:hypothetical protein [Polyangiaceae bacterium]